MKISYFLSYKIIILIIILSGCSNNSITVSEIMDPFEKMNRKVFTFNKKVDEKFISPISSTYEREIPASTRKAIRNHIDWLDTPNTILNSSFQIDFKNTILASAKFMLNGLTLGFYDLDKGETATGKGFRFPLVISTSITAKALMGIKINNIIKYLKIILSFQHFSCIKI